MRVHGVREERVHGLAAVRGAAREARDRLDAGGDEDVALAGTNRVRGHANGLQRRRAVAIDGDAGDVGQTGEQRRDARDVETRLAGRLTAADDEVFDALGVEFGQLGEDGANDERGEVVGAHVDERALEGATDGGSSGGDDDGFGHEVLLLLLQGNASISNARGASTN